MVRMVMLKTVDIAVVASDVIHHPDMWGGDGYRTPCTGNPRKTPSSTTVN